MKIKGLCLAAAAVAMIWLAPIASGKATHIDVRVIAKGAKFIGTSMGGAAVTIRDEQTGKILARGVTAGGTGDTGKIMRQPLATWQPRSSPEAAVYHATIDIDQPTRIKVTATGPLGRPQASNSVSITQWALPGHDITKGDGLLLVMPGFVVGLLSPAAHSKLGKAPQVVHLRARVTMMCGCPIMPGGLWDAKKLEIQAIIKRDGKVIETVPMKFTGRRSRFAATLHADKPGMYEVTVYAFDPADGNTGLDRTTFVVGK